MFTPYGREITASILYQYLKRDCLAGVVDEWMLWMNTDDDQESDRAYASELDHYNDWVSLRQRPDDRPVLHPKQMNTGNFYIYTQDPDTVYVRMDDDIVWIEQNAIARLVEQRLDNPMPFVVFPLIWNNAVCSYYLQQGQHMPSWWGEVGNHCMDPVGWANPWFAENIHNHLLDVIDQGDVDKLFMHHSIQLPVGHQFSVSCFAQSGDEYKKVDGQLRGEEEAWHTVNQPYVLGRPNLIVPNSLISHFSFYHQRDYLLNSTDILDRYRRLADDIHA